MGVQLALRHRWIGWDDSGRLLFQTPDGQRVVEAAPPCSRLAAQAGRGWGRTGRGSNSRCEGRRHLPLRPANCGFTVPWSDIFRDRFEGQPLKGVALSFGPHTARGEAIVTRSGIEGGAIYALSAELREALAHARHLHAPGCACAPTSR